MFRVTPLASPALHFGQRVCALAGCPRLQRALPAALAAVLIALGTLLSATAAAERIEVRGAELQLLDSSGEGGIILDAQFDFDLPPLLVDAVNRGIALYFVVEFELYRSRWYWFDRKVATAARTWRLTYSPLTRQYRLTTGTLAQPFDSLPEAMNVLKRAVSRIPAWPNTRSFGKPETFLATWHMASSGFETTIRIASGDWATAASVTEPTIFSFVLTRSSRLMSPVRGTPAVITTTSEPAVGS